MLGKVSMNIMAGRMIVTCFTLVIGAYWVILTIKSILTIDLIESQLLIILKKIAYCRGFLCQDLLCGWFNFTSVAMFLRE